jgi:hypothetical protein
MKDPFRAVNLSADGPCWQRLSLGTKLPSEDWMRCSTPDGYPSDATMTIINADSNDEARQPLRTLLSWEK